jgi:hypothetical protein
VYAEVQFKDTVVLVAVVVAAGKSEVLVPVEVADKFAIRSGAVSAVVVVPETLLDDAASLDIVVSEVGVSSGGLPVEDEAVEDESKLVGSELVGALDVSSIVPGRDEVEISVLVVSAVDVASVLVAAMSAATTVATPMVATIATIAPNISGRRRVIIWDRKRMPQVYNKHAG